MTLTVQITAKWVRNKKPGRGVSTTLPLPPQQKLSLIPPPWFCFLEILISTEMQNMEPLTGTSGSEDNDTIVAYWTMQPLSGLSRLPLIQKCLTKIHKKPRCNSRDAKKIIWNQCPSRLCSSTHSYKDTGSFLHIPSPSSKATHGETISSDNKKPRDKGSCETCCINESCSWYYPH